MSDKIEQQVIKLVAEVTGKKEITLESRFQEDLGADSLGITELIMNVEDKYGLSFPEEKLPEIKTVRNLSDYIKQNYKG